MSMSGARMPLGLSTGTFKLRRWLIIETASLLELKRGYIGILQPNLRPNKVDVDIARHVLEGIAGNVLHFRLANGV